MKLEHLSRRTQVQRLRGVAEQALRQFEVEPISVSLLAHAYNTTFTVVAADGRRYVLHILRHDAETLSTARVESELWWLDELRADASLCVPLPVRTSNGDGVVSVATEGMGQHLRCTLFHWIEGRLVRRLGPRHLEAVGDLTARLHHHSSRVSVPAGFDRPTVDAAEFETEKVACGLFADRVSATASRVVRAVLEHMRRAQSEIGGHPDTFGLIHADIHQKNYLFHGADVRLIDFGDCGWGHYLYDLGVTVHQLSSHPQRDELRAGLLAGYRRVRDISRAHEALIDSFVMLREVQDLTWFVKEEYRSSDPMAQRQVEEGVATLETLLRTQA